MMRVFLVFAVISVLAAQVKPGQLAPQGSSDETPTFRIGHTVVVAPTTVLTKKGDYVDGLQLQDFTLFDNGKPQKITADVSAQPISLVMAVQRSNMLTDILPKVQKIGNEVNDLVVGNDGD